MSTRALVHFKEEGLDSPTIVTMYRHSDGYPERPGLGADIFKALNGGLAHLVDGIGFGNTESTFNGMACLTAWLIGELKGGTIGGVYLFPPDSSDCGEEYTYTIYELDGEVCMKIDGVGQGPLHSFNCEKGVFFPVAGEDETFSVESDSDHDTYYNVTHVAEKWICECMDHTMRKHDCKHIRRVRGD